MINKPFVNNLRTHRKNAGVLQLDVACYLVHESTDRVSHWEKGSAVPLIVKLFNFSVLYEVCPHELYGELCKNIEAEDSRPASPQLNDAPSELD